MKPSSVPTRLQSKPLSAPLFTIISTLLFLNAATWSRADVSPPQISQIQAGADGSVSLQWNAVPDTGYRVLSSTSLSGGVWSAVDYITASSNSVTWLANGQSGTACFYRLATDAISILGVEPALIPTGTPVDVYVTGQGFGPNDTLRLIGPGGPLVLTNRIIISPKLLTFTVGPSFTADLAGDYQLEITSGSSGQKATLTYAWTLVLAPAGSRALLEPPGIPPAMPALMKAKEKANQVKSFVHAGENGTTSEGRRALWGIGGNLSLRAMSSGAEGLSDEDDMTSSMARGIVTCKPGSGSTGSAAGKTAGHIRGGIRSPGDDVGMRQGGSVGVTIRPPPHCPQARLFSGEVQLQDVDMMIPGRGLDFIWARTYRSRTAARSGMTYSWTCSYDVSVSQTSDGMAVFDGTGRSDVYHPDTNGVYTRNEFFNEGRLTKNIFTLTFPDTGRWVFNPLDGSVTAGKLGQIVDRNGNAMSFSYDSAGRLYQIVDDLNRTNTVAYNSAGQLFSITDFSGRAVTYQYYGAKESGGAPGDLKSVTSPPVVGTPNGNDFPTGKTTTYTYSSGFANDAENHLLLSITDPKLQTLHQFTYDHNAADFAYLRCVAEQYGTNTPTLYTWTPYHVLPGQSAVVQCTVNDPLGNVTECYYDSCNRLVMLRDFTGRATPGVPTTDTLNRPAGKLRSADPDYFETQWSWNRDSLCVKELEPQGNAVQCVYESDFDKGASARKKGDLRVCRELPCCADLDRDGFADLVTRYQYDPNFGSPANPGPFYHAINTKGTGTGGITEDTTGSAYHAINTKGTGTGGITEEMPASACHAINTKGTGTGGRTVGTGVNGQGMRTSAHAYEVLYATSITDPRGTTTRCTYDIHGNCVHVAEGDVPVPVITWEPCVFDMAYNTYGQLTAVTNAPDENGRRRVDAANYYKSGPQTGYMSDWTIDTQGPTLIQSTFEYDSRGNLMRCVDPRGNDWLCTYNALDQLVQESSPPLGGSVRVATQYSYDAADNLTHIDQENRDYNGVSGTNPVVSTQFIYDSLNRMSGCWRDKDGHLVLRCTEVKYDANDNVVLYRSGEAVNGDDTNKVVQFQYDERDLLFRCVTAPGTTIASTNQYDYTLNACKSTPWKHHDIQGLDTPEQAITTYTYDGFHRPISALDAMGNVTTNRLDANGNVILCSLYGETNDVPGSAGNQLLAQTACIYDPHNRPMKLNAAHFSASGQPIGDGLSTTSYAYAPNGACLSATDDNSHATRYSYDTVGRLATVTDAKLNTVMYAYDACANVTGITQADRSDLGGALQTFARSFTFDNAGRCASSSDNAGNHAQYFYDSRNNLLRQMDANGNVSGWTYDGLNRVTLVIADLDGDGMPDFANDAGTLFVYDDNDCVLSCTDANSNATSYAYDARDRCLVATNADNTTHRMIWSPRSNLITETDENGTVISNTYDLRQRVIHRDIACRIGVATTTTFETFAYDGCSRLMLASNDVSRVTYAYDSLNDCTSSSQDGLQPTTCVFDGVGNCLSMTYPGGRVVTYAYDALNEVTDVGSGAGGLPPSNLAHYQYDGPGDCKGYQRKNGAIIAADYDYKERARLSRITRANGVGTQIKWDGLQSPPNTKGDFGWQQVQTVNHTRGAGQIVDQRTLGYDHNQNKVVRTQTAPFVQGQDTLTNTWEYTPLDQLSRASNTKGTGATVRSYHLDHKGNRIAVTNDGAVELYTRDSASPPADFQMDQYTLTPFGSQTFDDNGNLLSRSSAAGAWQYQYDYADRLVQVNDLSTGAPAPVATYTYDVFGNRLSKTTYPGVPAMPVTTYYVHGGGETDLDCGGTCGILEARSGGAGGAGGVVIHVYCWGEAAAAPSICATWTLTPNRLKRMGRPAINTALASFSGSGALEYYFHSDDLGNVLALTDGGGNVLERYEYDDYGLPHFLTSDGVETSASSSVYGNPFLFHGMEWDSETGFYSGKRYSTDPYVEDCQRTYDPHTGNDLRRYCDNPSHESPCCFEHNNPWSMSAANNPHNVTKAQVGLGNVLDRQRLGGDILIHGDNSVSVRAPLKGHFQSGDKPTSAQFSAMIDSCVNRIGCWAGDCSGR